MKKILFPIALTLFTAGFLVSGCESSAEKVQNAEKNVADAQVKLDQARIDSAAEYEKAKIAWTEKIERNNKIMADYKIKIAKEKKNAKARDEARLEELQTKNEGLRTKMSEFKTAGMNTWADFKTSFNKAANDFDNEMTEFGKSLSSMVR